MCDCYRLFHVETYSDNILNCPPQLNESGELDFGHEDEDDDDAGDAQNLDVTATVDDDDTDTENNEPHAHNEEEDDESDEPKPDVATPKVSINLFYTARFNLITFKILQRKMCYIKCLV